MREADSVRGEHSAGLARDQKRDAFRWRSELVAWAVLMDVACLVGANLLAIGMEGVWHMNQPFHVRPDMVTSTIFLVSTFILMAFSLGLYRSMFRTAWVEQLHLGVRVGLYAGIPFILIQFFLHFRGYDTSYFVFFTLFLALLFFLDRSVLIFVHRSMVHRGRGITRSIILRGSNNKDPRLAVLEQYSGDLGLRLEWNLDSYTMGDDNVHAYHAPWKEEIPAGYQQVFISSPNGSRALISDAVEWCKSHGLSLNLLSSEVEPFLWSLGIRDVTGIPLVGTSSSRTRKVNRGLKRLFDIFASLIMIVVCLPVFAFIAVAIAIEDGGPVIYRQRRALLPGKEEFWMYKFRSMRQGAESFQDEMHKQNQTTPGLFFVKRDPRITKVGRIIRRLSLDELPQLVNVMKGDMSIVGPRPLMLDDLARVSPHVFEGGLFSLRKDVHPGLTGLWQISGRRELTVQKMLLLDLYYIEHQSVFFDLYIMARTFLVVLFGKGAY
jgi:exopolysaccharide biosynthesis polyprenyl glycosylphosphotransferase